MYVGADGKEAAGWSRTNMLKETKASTPVCPMELNWLEGANREERIHRGKTVPNSVTRPTMPLTNHGKST